VTQRQLAFVVPALLTLHNLEEALTWPRWLPDIQARVPISLRPWFAEVSLDGMYVALIVSTVVPWAIALWSVRRSSNAIAIWFLLLVQAVVLLNAFWHLLVAGGVLRGYSPGLVTAATLNLPFSIYLFRRATREQWCSPRALMALVPATLIVHGPILVGLIDLVARRR
jgi:hypothetical protein